MRKNQRHVHCATHNLNLVLNDACSGVPEIKSFYDTLNKIFVFFSASNIRWGLLETEISKTSKGMSTKTKPKKDNQAAAKKSSHTAVESSTNQRKTSQIASKLTLKRVCTTRWSSRHDALKALRHN